MAEWPRHGAVVVEIIQPEIAPDFSGLHRFGEHDVELQVVGRQNGGGGIECRDGRSRGGFGSRDPVPAFQPIRTWFCSSEEPDEVLLAGQKREGG